jgi:serine/threonine-protein kinase
VTDLVGGRYEIVETISTRERASLHKARDCDLDKFVALKVLVLSDTDSLDDLRSEAKILQHLQHSNLPTFRHDFVLPDGTYVMVIDWVDGIDLEEKVCASGRPGLVHSSVVDWVVQVADALDYLHEQDPPIVHGDVKPSNIVLARTNRAVLLDFGIARRAGQSSNAGTQGFMAPEVAMGDPVSTATDVYGLAATTYMLLTGKPPGSAPPDIPDLDSTHMAALEQVLQHALATDPARRFASAGQFAARLRTAHELLPPGNITLLATEIVDYDGLWDRDPGLMDDVLPRVESMVRIAVDEGDGRVAIDSGGEHMLAGFLGASAALRTALAVRARSWDDLGVRNGAIRLRIALHTGEPEHTKGTFRGASVNGVQRLCRSADPGQILVSSTTAALLMDRMPAGTRLVEVALQHDNGSTTTSGPVYSVETGELPPLTPEPGPPPPAPVVPPPPYAAPPRRRTSDEMAQLIRERNELQDGLTRKLHQENEAQRAGQHGLAAKFGEEAAELGKRLLELGRRIERLEAEEGGGARG